MNKILLHLLTALLLVFIALPNSTRAATGDSDYVALQVPDLRQAVTFFHDVLNCAVISEQAGADIALLDCGNQTTLELSRRAASRVGGVPQSMRLDTDDATAVVSWLHTHGVRLTSKPTRVVNGPDTGKIAVTFLTPWGQPLQLVSRFRSNELLQTTTPAARLAAQ